MTKRPRHRRHANPFNVRGPIAVPDWPSLFGREAPLALDVGFGAGQFLLALAENNPRWDVIGIEIRQHFVDQVLAAARRAELKNLFACVANASLHLSELVPDASLVLVTVNFPDPWYKKRHHKRRIIQPAWLDTLAKKLRPDGQLHLNTDYAPGAEAAKEVLEAHPRFVETEGTAVETGGVLTEREAWHLEKGDPIYRLRYTLG